MSRTKTAALIPMLAIALGVMPAHGAPSSVAIEAVFRRSACDPVCDPDDGGLKQGTTVSGAIQIHVRASSEVVGLGFVRLEAQTGTDPFYYCLQQWETGGARDFETHFDWDTPNWPGPQTPDWGCPETVPHHHGAPAEDGSYRMRVTASEAVNEEQASSNDFVIRIENDAQPTTTPTNTPSSSTGTQTAQPSNSASASPSIRPSRSASPTPSAGTTLPSVTASPSLFAAGDTTRRASPGARPFVLFFATVALGTTASMLVQRIRRPVAGR